MMISAEYLWLDGATPTKAIRSKTRILELAENGEVDLSDFPDWTYDGSSTYQAPGDKSDLVLKPVRVVPDPIHRDLGYLVLCEVFYMDGSPFKSNTRAELRALVDGPGQELDAWLGIEQEYTLFIKNRPLGWPKTGYPQPQGPFYCGVGADRSFGRPIALEHMELCLDAGLTFFGLNAEVMPAQWEFQIGYRGFSDEVADPLTVSDHLWIARWLLLRVAENYRVTVSFDNKPIAGDWNGSGAHTNFSTKLMRDKKTGRDSIERLISVLEKRHKLHIDGYGHGLHQRLTGHHETCDIDTFRFGQSDRGASIRIPHAVTQSGSGYIEDRRPGANCDPYVVSALLLEAAILSQNQSINKKAVAALNNG